MMYHPSGFVDVFWFAINCCCWLSAIDSTTTKDNKIQDIRSDPIPLIQRREWIIRMLIIATFCGHQLCDNRRSDHPVILRHFGNGNEEEVKEWPSNFMFVQYIHEIIKLLMLMLMLMLITTTKRTVITGERYVSH